MLMHLYYFTLSNDRQLNYSLRKEHCYLLGQQGCIVKEGRKEGKERRGEGRERQMEKRRKKGRDVGKEKGGYMYFMLPFLYHYSNSLLETDLQSFMSHPRANGAPFWV